MHPKWGIFRPKFCIFKNKLPTRRTFSDRLKFSEGNSCPFPAYPSCPRHGTTDDYVLSTVIEMTCLLARLGLEGLMAEHWYFPASSEVTCSISSSRPWSTTRLRAGRRPETRDQDTCGVGLHQVSNSFISTSAKRDKFAFFLGSVD